MSIGNFKIDDLEKYVSTANVLGRVIFEAVLALKTLVTMSPEQREAIHATSEKYVDAMNERATATAMNHDVRTSETEAVLSGAKKDGGG